VSFTNAAAALEAAHDIAQSAAAEAVEKMGGANPQVRVSAAKHLLPDAVDDNGLLEAKVTAEAIGRPETA